MEFFTVRAGNFDDALRKMRALYGNEVIIHSRRDIPARGPLRRMRKGSVEIVGYLSRERRNSQEASSAAEAPVSGSAKEVETLTREVERMRRELSLRQERKKRYQTAAGILQDLLRQNDFSKPFSDRAVHEILGHPPEEESADRLTPATVDHTLFENRISLESALLGFITDSITIDEEAGEKLPRVVIQMGPTGVGKTTTTAKLAARCRYRQKSKPAIVSLDTFRIGAGEQIKTFGTILEVPVTQISSPLELDTFLRKTGAGYDHVLIDTIGKSPKDREIFDEMRRILSVCGSGAETRFFLTLAASMKAEDMKSTIERFKPFGVSSLIITKFDETDFTGNVISTAFEADLPLAFFSTGQRVPQDLEPASIALLMKSLKGFNVDLTHLTFGEFAQGEKG